MSQTQVVILTAQSLFIEGIISRLKKYPQRIDLTIINPVEHTNYLEQIIKIQPSTLILNSIKDKEQNNLPLPLLLKELPSLRVIYLDIMKNTIQVVNSSTLTVERVGELLEIITAEPGSDELLDILVGPNKNTIEEVVPKKL